jgi:hypothetical protein
MAPATRRPARLSVPRVSNFARASSFPSEYQKPGGDWLGTLNNAYSRVRTRALALYLATLSPLNLAANNKLERGDRDTADLH